MISGIIFDIKRYAIHDGPGIRTTIFMKGCPLSCWWCHNPEGVSPKPELMYFEFKCIHCHTCVKVCPENAISFDENETQQIDREKCTGCGVCASACPTSALRLVGRVITVEELLTEIEKDIKLYDDSGGGVTFSGGEPLSQPKFLVESLKELKKRYIHTTVDTSGYAPKEVLKQILPHTDLFLYDIKLYDSGENEKYTGVPNDIIIENLKFLTGQGKEVILRFPIIPGITDTDKNVKGWTNFISEIKGINEIDLLPFHDVSEKFRRIGREYKMTIHHRPPDEILKWIKEEFESIGLRVKIGG
ncbi:glycyl-radical enzyme activating protein [Thermococcus sp.]|uniref:glycyl-radical enzyme activating protein n=1 Tax=Thermococcus sp. TaxID=35749 RepID=UPI00076DE0F1|nr:glycyl-radical enzyme activating protein [Thermococcus sp.]KUK28822.1 MAG: Pyruvate-formate lyase-activating enzyme [Thermococcus sp. 40_45]MBC7094377.1 glycyl-radical enzyme activating protein [Thermococcus sp.]HII67585.1 glycyl-radical enzyme activating protein [Thermococcaceae archaeon]